MNHASFFSRRRPIPPDGPTQSAMVVEVDNIVEGGGERHRALLQELGGIITCGKVVNLQERETTYAGKSVRQLPDYSFTLHMDEYMCIYIYI